MSSTAWSTGYKRVSGGVCVPLPFRHNSAVVAPISSTAGVLNIEYRTMTEQVDEPELSVLEKMKRRKEKAREGQRRFLLAVGRQILDVMLISLGAALLGGVFAAFYTGHTAAVLFQFVGAFAGGLFGAAFSLVWFARKSVVADTVNFATGSDYSLDSSDLSLAGKLAALGGSWGGCMWAFGAHIRDMNPSEGTMLQYSLVVVSGGITAWFLISAVRSRRLRRESKREPGQEAWRGRKIEVPEFEEPNTEK